MASNRKRSTNGKRPKERKVGNCVYTTAELIEDFAEAPDLRLDVLFWPQGGIHSWGSNGHDAIRIRQRGNGSIRLVYEIPRLEGGGSFKPFAFPAPYRPCTSYPLDANGIDPRDKSPRVLNPVIA